MKNGITLIFMALLAMGCIYVPSGTQLVDREPLDDRRFRNLGHYSQLYVGMPRLEVLRLFPDARLHWQNREDHSNSIYVLNEKQKYVTKEELVVTNAANLTAKRRINEDFLTEEQKEKLHRKDAEAVYQQELAETTSRAYSVQPIRPTVSTSTGYFEFEDDRLVAWE